MGDKMEGFGMFFLALFLLSIIVIIGCLASLITDSRNKKEMLREDRRKKLSESTVRTILGYKADRYPNAEYYYRRRA